MRCRHKNGWENAQSQFFAPPELEGQVKLEGSAESVAQLWARSFEGYTVVTQKCTKCGELRSVELRGHVTV